MKGVASFSALAALAASATAQNASMPMPGVNNTNINNSILRQVNATRGPPLEEVHYYYGQWPIGIAVASDGRLFASYTRGSQEYTVGIIVNKTAEAPYPTSGPVRNLGPDSINTTMGGIDFGVNSTNLISVQALYITPETNSRPETLWLLDTGRPTIHNGQNEPSMVYAQPGGPKLIAVSLQNNTAYRSYTFPPDVHYPDSYLNDLRFDLRPDLTTTTGSSGQAQPMPSGVAYLVDSSNEGRPGFIMVDLATGDSWRRLNQDPSVLRTPNNVPSYFNEPFYYRALGMPVSWQQEGLDGLQLSPNGERLYYSPLTSTHLYSIPTANLRVQSSDPLAELMARSNVSDYDERGANGANGFEGDDQGRIYQLMPTQNSVYYFDPRDLQTHGFITDPRILWPDGASVGADGYIYLNINQLPFQPDWNNEMDGRMHPGAILRAKLPDGARKISTLG